MTGRTRCARGGLPPCRQAPPRRRPRGLRPPAATRRRRSRGGARRSADGPVRRPGQSGSRRTPGRARCRGWPAPRSPPLRSPRRAVLPACRRGRCARPLPMPLPPARASGCGRACPRPRAAGRRRDAPPPGPAPCAAARSGHRSAPGTRTPGSSGWGWQICARRTTARSASAEPLRARLRRQGGPAAAAAAASAPPATSASCAIVGRFARSRGVKRRPAWRQRAITWMVRIESPPSSKKLSSIADPRRAEDLGPDRGERFFGRVARRYVGPRALEALEVGRGQRLAVHLAVLRQRQRFRTTKCAGTM